MDFPTFSLFDENLIPEWAEDDHIPDKDLLSSVETLEDKHLSSRFPTLCDAELTAIVENSQTKSTKKTTKWLVKTFEGTTFFYSTLK